MWLDKRRLLVALQKNRFDEAFGQRGVNGGAIQVRQAKRRVCPAGVKVVAALKAATILTPGVSWQANPSPCAGSASAHATSQRG
jgi:hypothetical protein